MVQIKIKLLTEGCVPTKAHHNDAAYDCYAAQDATIYPCSFAKVPLGFSYEIPDGYEIQIRGRSGMANKGLPGHFGTCDAGYRGEVCAIIYYVSNPKLSPIHIKKGDRVAQMVIQKVEESNLVLVDEVRESIRGANGFGSTGR